MNRLQVRSRSNKLFLLSDILFFSIVSYVVSTFLYEIDLGIFIAQLGPTLVVLGLSLYLFSAFEITLEASLSSLLSRNMLAVMTAVSIMLVVIYILGPGSGKNVYGRGVLLMSFGIFGIYLFFTRFARFRYLRHLRPVNNWFYIGSDEHFSVIQEETKDLKRHEVFQKDTAYLAEVLEDNKDVKVILDNEIYASSEFASDLLNEKFGQGRILSIDQFYENFLEKVPIFNIRDFWFINNTGFDVVRNSIRQRAKRALDIFLVVLTAPVTIPLCVVASLLIFLSDVQSPFYTQARVGWHGRNFTILKLRTMYRKDTGFENNWTSKNDSRVTRLGRVLRKYRLDELPQLLNVAKGDMSIIGPRPEQPEYTKMLEQEIPYYDIRHSLKPGITGWAQVKYTYGASIKDSRAKLEYDLYYIKNYSILLDLTILIKTVYTVFSGGGR